MVLYFFISCKTGPEPVQTRAAEPVKNTVTEKPPEAVIEPPRQGTKTEQTTEPMSGTHPVRTFDPSTISQEEKAHTKIEIQHLIQQLNGIIRAKNFNAWVSYLSPDYFAIISSAEYLDKISQSAILVKQTIVLKSAQDYFIHVVVPARTNDRVDEIEFESQSRVKAYTINAKGEKLRLYDLERTGKDWKIIN
jgi:hypothetical protein